MTDRFQSQAAVSEFADLCWIQLHEIIEAPTKKKRPPVYLFLSKESEGSLSERSLEEQDFVHHQQYHQGAATLKAPPLAYVSTWQQVAEECAHLFAIICKPEKSDVIRSIEEEVNHVVQHESFGRFFHCLQMGLPKRRQVQSRKSQVRSPQDIWQIGHQEGYALGEKIAHQFFSEKLNRRIFESWFWKKWPSKQSLRQLYRLAEAEPKAGVILDILAK